MTNKEITILDIYEIIKAWWNDTMRKNWRNILADPPKRLDCFDDLAEKIVSHLKREETK